MFLSSRMSFKAYSRARKVKNIKMKSRFGDIVCHQKLLLGALEHSVPVTIRDLLVKWGTDRHTYRHLELIGVFVVVMMMMCWWRWLPHPPPGDDLMMMNWQLQHKYLIVLPIESLVEKSLERSNLKKFNININWRKGKWSSVYFVLIVPTEKQPLNIKHSEWRIYKCFIFVTWELPIAYCSH